MPTEKTEASQDLVALLWLFAGFDVAMFSMVLPFAVAAAMGAYLFYAQHTYEGLRILPTEEWTYFQGALESSSYMKLGPIMKWFTGNIGYHHVHHLNPHILFYRLPGAMAAIPELQHPVVTSLGPRDIRFFWQSLRPPVRPLGTRGASQRCNGRR